MAWSRVGPIRYDLRVGCYRRRVTGVEEKWPFTTEPGLSAHSSCSVFPKPTEIRLPELLWNCYEASASDCGIGWPGPAKLCQPPDSRTQNDSWPRGRHDVCPTSFDRLSCPLVGYGGRCLYDFRRPAIDESGFVHTRLECLSRCSATDRTACPMIVGQLKKCPARDASGAGTVKPELSQVSWFGQPM